VISPVAKHLPSFARPAPQNSLYERHCIRSIRNCAGERARAGKQSKSLTAKVAKKSRKGRKENQEQFFAIFAAFLCDLAVKRFSPSLELSLRRSLLRAHTTGHNLGRKVALALHRRTGEAPQDRELSHMRERIGNRPLK